MAHKYHKEKEKMSSHNISNDEAEHGGPPMDEIIRGLESLTTEELESRTAAAAAEQLESFTTEQLT